MTKLRTVLLVGAAGLLFMTGIRAADQTLSGAITSASGQKLDGVTVYAKMDGSTVTTAVYTDGSGTLSLPAARRRQVPRLGAGARLRGDEGDGRPGRDAQARPRAAADHRPGAALPADAE